MIRTGHRRSNTSVSHFPGCLIAQSPNRHNPHGGHFSIFVIFDPCRPRPAMRPVWLKMKA
jgi:hypothetical protein